MFAIFYVAAGLAMTILCHTSEGFMVSPNRRIVGPFQQRKLYASSKKAPENEATEQTAKKKFSVGDLIQLVTMGAGAPSLGEYQGTDDTGRMMFKLEANNLVDSEGNVLQTRGKYFEEGYVEDDKEFASKPPGFWQNLASGGELQRKWDEQERQRK